MFFKKVARVRPFCISPRHLCVEIQITFIMIKVEHSICELLQNSNITKKDLKFYISKGSKDALVLLYLGLTTHKCNTIIEHYWDEETNEILFANRNIYNDEEYIIEAEEFEIEGVTRQIKELLKQDDFGEAYKKVLVEETEDLEILKHYADHGDDEAKHKVELIEWRNSTQE